MNEWKVNIKLLKFNQNKTNLINYYCKIIKNNV